MDLQSNSQSNYAGYRWSLCSTPMAKIEGNVWLFTAPDASRHVEPNVALACSLSPYDLCHCTVHIIVIRRTVGGYIRGVNIRFPAPYVHYFVAHVTSSRKETSWRTKERKIRKAIVRAARLTSEAIYRQTTELHHYQGNYSAAVAIDRSLLITRKFRVFLRNKRTSNNEFDNVLTDEGY